GHVAVSLDVLNRPHLLILLMKTSVPNLLLSSLSKLLHILSLKFAMASLHPDFLERARKDEARLFFYELFSTSELKFTYCICSSCLRRSLFFYYIFISLSTVKILL